MPSPAQPVTLILLFLLSTVASHRRAKNKNLRWIKKMQISLPLLFLFIGSTSTKKQGDFGILTACITQNNLRLDCYYGECKDSPPFSCEFMTNGSLLANPLKICRIVITGHHVLYSTKITNYTCTLTRKSRMENKTITIDYSIRKGKNHIKPCPDTTGLLLHRAPTLLLPVVILSLWRVLSTDTQTT